VAGVDWPRLLASAVEVSGRLRSNDPARNTGLQLGAILAAGVRTGRDKLTLLIDPRIASFGLWLEQLVAESTGKSGTGVVPVVDEAPAPVDRYGDDRLFVAVGHPDHGARLDALREAGHPVISLAFEDLHDLGAQVLVWEVATAVCAMALGINPFDQPNVAEAKAATNEVLASGPLPIPQSSLAEVLGSVQAGDYLAICAFVDPAGPEVDQLEAIRSILGERFAVATTFGLGPRFLHSTGQLHKGGPPSGVFLQVVGDDPSDAPIAGRDLTFSQLKRAQADGDLLTLANRGLRAARATTAEILAYLA
jgi:hypothetical protein